MNIHRLSFAAITLAALTLLPPRCAQGQTFSLPVYTVTQTGATYDQATNLANLLNVPINQMMFTNGMVQFIDPTNFLYIPTTPVTDPTVISNLTAVTQNPTTNPLSFYALDFTGLSNLTVLSSNAALSSATGALASVGLTPAYGTPVIGNNQLAASYWTTNNVTNTVSAYLDTSVSYHFTDPGGLGYPMIGPGAQIRLTYGSTGNVTRLTYSARQYAPGPVVSIISSNQASSLAAALMPTNAVINSIQLVYYSPPLWSGVAPACCISTVIPWYACSGIMTQTNPVTGSNIVVRTPVQLIPATTDPNYVPSVNLTASAPGLTQVVASAAVSGGAPPYTYAWGGSNPAVSTNSSASITYTPQTRVAIPPVRISSAGPVTTGTITLSWPDTPTTFSLQSTTDLVTTAWSDVSATAIDSNGTNVVTVPVGGLLRMFFRLRQASLQTDTVSVVVTDVNGVSASASATLVTSPQPIPGSVDPPVATYGIEDPYDVVLNWWIADQAGFQTIMSTYPPFGGAARSQAFCWTKDLSWPGDFMEPTPKATLQPILPSCGPGPTAYADADLLNWGVNGANLVLYMGHGGPTILTFTWPNPPPSSGLCAYWLQLDDPTVNMLATYSDYATCWHFNLTNSWGNQGPNDHLNWLCFDACEVLQYSPNHFNENNPDSPGNFPSPYPWDFAGYRWGGAFNGLHSTMGYHTDSWGGCGTPGTFAVCLLGIRINLPFFGPIVIPGQTIVQAWLSASNWTQPAGVVAAAMGPIGPNGATDFRDYYPAAAGNPTVGPSIPPSMIQGWWYVHN